MTHPPIKRPADNLTFAQIEAIALDEGVCLAFFERMRFPGGLVVAKRDPCFARATWLG